MSRKRIEIKSLRDNESYMIPVTDGKLEKQVLKDYFGEDGFLTYEDDGRKYLLYTDENFVHLEDKVESYIWKAKDNFAPGNPLKGSQRPRFDEIVQSLYKAKDEKLPKKKLGESKINSSGKVNPKPVTNKILKRNIHVGWKHRRDILSPYKHIGSGIAPTKVLEFDGRRNYSYDDLKKILIDRYVCEDNAAYFDGATVEVGTSNDVIVKEFIVDGTEVNIWEFFRDFRTKNHLLRINLLTTKNLINSVSLDNLPTCSSLINEPQKYRNVNSEINEASVISSDTEEGPQEIEIKVNGVDNNLIVVKGQENDDQRDHKENSSPENGEFDEKVFKTPNQSTKKRTENFSVSPGSTKKSKMNTTSVDSDDDDDEEIHFSPREKLFRHEVEKVKGSVEEINESELKRSEIVLVRGSQGVVVKGRFRTTKVAVKSMQRGSNDKFSLKELLHLDKIRHPNIVNVLAVAYNITQMHLVMEYFPSNSLHDILFKNEVKQRFNLNNVNKNRICLQLSCALAYLHEQPKPIVHRDIKPGNLLVNHNFVIKICDLGLATSPNVNDTLKSTRNSPKGTYLFMAPEIVLHQKEATTASDIWSMACTIVELYDEKCVWDVGSSFNGWMCVQERLNKGDIPSLQKVPKYMSSIVQKMLQYNPINRPSSKESLNVFQEYADSHEQESVY